MIANRDGAKDELGIAYVLRDSMGLSVLAAIPITIMIWSLAPALLWLGQSETLVRIATPYLHALAWSVLPDLIGLTVLQLVIGLGHARTNLVFTISWVVLNIIANYVLVFGRFGAPALGIAGLGWGTTLSFWITTIAWLIYLIAHKRYRYYFTKLLAFDKPFYYWELIKVGMPTGLMLSIEVSFFFVMLVLIGQRGIQPLAASQVAMQYIGLFVSILFSIAQAVTVVVSNRLGANEPSTIRNAAHSGIALALLSMGILAIISWAFPNVLIAIDFSPTVQKNATIIHDASVYLAIGMGFMLLEAVRITLFGALRGLKDTRSTLLCSLVSFWIIAIPLGEFFANQLQLGAAGSWLGLLVSGLFSAGFLIHRFSTSKLIASSTQSP